MFVFRHGTASHDSYSEGMFRTLLESHQRLEQEMAAVATEWQDCEKRIDDYVDEQVDTHRRAHTFTYLYTMLCTFPGFWYKLFTVSTGKFDMKYSLISSLLCLAAAFQGGWTESSSPTARATQVFSQ